MHCALCICRSSMASHAWPRAPPQVWLDIRGAVVQMEEEKDTKDHRQVEGCC